MSPFSKQIVVVTGATRGIGRSIAEAFLKEGATVVGLYVGNHEAAESFKVEAADLGGTLELECCDVADSAQVDAFYGELEGRHGRIDVLVSNAGIRRDSLVALMKEEDWQKVLDINLSGSFRMARQAVLMMLSRRYGRIIFITSPMAHLGFAGQGNYAASKAGQIGLMRSLSKECAKKKITVNCVSPGFIDTELITDLSPEQVASYKKLVPMRRFGRPQEVADGVLFLAGPKASYITGTVLEINGGL